MWFRQISTDVGAPKADLPVPPVIPVSKLSWWQGVKDRRFPKPVKLGPRITIWLADEVRDLVKNADRKSVNHTLTASLRAFSALFFAF